MTAADASRIVGRAHARAGLLGNPSDGYGGKTVSCIVGNWTAEVRLTPAPRLTIVPGDDEAYSFASLESMVDDVRQHGYYGGVRLIKAALKRFWDYHADRTELNKPNFKLEYSSSIPRQLGLGGSSAIIIATLRALQQYFEVTIEAPWQPSVALACETMELGIPAGLQDRVIQSYEGLVFMDFAPEASVVSGDLIRGTYVDLDPSLLPPLYLAFANADSEPTEVVHSNLRQRFAAGDAAVVGAMQQFAQIALDGRLALEHGDFKEFGRLIDENFNLRRSICAIHPRHQQMIDAARSLGLPAKFCGSGGAIVGLLHSTDDWSRLAAKMQEIGCEVIRPRIGVWNRLNP